MARGDRPLPFEQLEPYMRGAKFAAVALGRRHMDHDPDLQRSQPSGPGAKALSHRAQLAAIERRLARCGP